MDSYVGPRPLLELIGGGLRLRPQTYRDFSGARDATRLCVAIAVLAGAASAPLIRPALGLVLAVALVLGIRLSLGILFAESLLVWAVTRLALREPCTLGQILRPFAHAHAPRVAYLLVPLVGYPPVLGLGISLWLIAAFVVAVEAATRRGWGVAVAVSVLVGVLRWLSNGVIQGL